MTEHAIPLSRGANQSRYFFSLKRSPCALAVVAFNSLDDAPHALSGAYEVWLTLAAATQLDTAELLGQAGKLTLTGEGSAQTLHGLVTHVRDRRRNLDRFEYDLCFASPLHPLKQDVQSRVFLRRNPVEIAKEILEKACIQKWQMEFQCRHDYPQRELTAQFQESDYDFLSRLLAHWGLFYYFEQTDESYKLVIRDHVYELPRLAKPDLLRYREQSGQSRGEATLYRLQSESKALTRAVRLKDHNYRTPTTNLEVRRESASELPGRGTDYRYGEHHQTREEGAWLAQVRLEAIDWQRRVYHAETDCCALAPGRTFTLTEHPNPALNGDYLVVQVSHRGDQGSGDAGTRDSTGRHYSNRVVLIRSGTPYRQPLPCQPPVMRGSLTAQVENDSGNYPHLDEQGRYKLRLPYDLGDAKAPNASHPVRMMQPYGGHRYGFHFPLHAGTEVALGHLNGNPDRPFILGALPNPETPSPVTADNPTQHILRTWGGNELLFEDRAGQQRIELFTRDRQNILRLDASKDAHLVHLASEQGDMKIEAGKTVLQTSGDSHTLEAGNDHRVTVENNQRLMTKNKAIQLNAASDIDCKAKQHIRARAEAQNVEITAGRDTIQTTKGTASHQVEQGNLDMRVENGRFSLRVAKSLTVKGEGGGVVHMGQAGCSFEIDAQGNLNLAGNTLRMDFQTIHAKGQNVDFN